MKKQKKIHPDLEVFLDKDREDEIKDLENFTEEDYAFLDEFREMTEDYR